MHIKEEKAGGIIKYLNIIWNVLKESALMPFGHVLQKLSQYASQ